MKREEGDEKKRATRGKQADERRLQKASTARLGGQQTQLMDVSLEKEGWILNTREAKKKGTGKEKSHLAEGRNKVLARNFCLILFFFSHSKIRKRVS